MLPFVKKSRNLQLFDVRKDVYLQTNVCRLSQNNNLGVT